MIFLLLIWPKTALNQRSGMILEVQIQSFHFPKIPGGLNIKFFCENRHEASFYIKEQMQENKFEISVLKTTILDPRKSAFLVFDEKPTNKFFLCVSALIQL